MPSFLQFFWAGGASSSDRARANDTLGEHGEAAMVRLAASFIYLDVDGELDTTNPDRSNAMSTLLNGLEHLAAVLDAHQVPRTYRSAFTTNYRLLFPGMSRNYRLDVLEAFLDNSPTIWVNGDKYDFSREAMHRGEVLQRQWRSLCELMRRWTACLGTSMLQPGREEVRAILNALDQAWARFEEMYISDLIYIEGRARQLLVHAIKNEARLTEIESRFRQRRTDCADVTVELRRDTEYRDAQRQLVGSIARINSVANTRRKGRDDLGASILIAAGERLAHGSSGVGDVLVENIFDSFLAMRKYLQGINNRLERVDPNLSNNPELVAMLVDWEESWEIGGRYVQTPALLDAFSGCIAELQRCQSVAPEFKAMCEDCDVELFLVLPRLIWLWLLATPLLAEPLLKSLLPSRFQDGLRDTEVQALLRRCESVAQLLGGPAAMHVHLVQRAVKGADYGRQSGSTAAQAANELMKDLEGLSMEMQRSDPSEWNQFSAILLQCLEKTALQTVGA